MSRRLALLLALSAVAGCHPALQTPAQPKADLRPAIAAADPTPLPSWLDGGTASNAAAALPASAAPAGPDPMAAEIKRERALQQALPQSGDPMWRLLHTSRIIEDQRTGYYSAVHPPAVRALAGKTVTISGFMLPIEQETQTRHFLVSRYTPVCFFCPPGDPNEVVEVRTVNPRPAGCDMVKVTGTFSIADNGEKGLFFRLQATN
jgi:hypothetical protein